MRPQFFDVQVEQLAGPRAFIANDGLRRIESAQSIQPEAPLRENDRRERKLELLRDVQRATPLPAESEDLTALRAPQPTGRATGTT